MISLTGKKNSFFRGSGVIEETIIKILLTDRNMRDTANRSDGANHQRFGLGLIWKFLNFSGRIFGRFRISQDSSLVN